MSVSFGVQPIGTRSMPIKIRVTNRATVAVTLNNISITDSNGRFHNTRDADGNLVSTNNADPGLLINRKK
jgi:hypothetical protein